MSHFSLTCYRQDSSWQLANTASVPSELSGWLLDTGSLTKKLKQVCEPDGRFHVRLLSQRWLRPLPSEAEVLGMNVHEIAMAREVALCNEETPWVFARTIIPARSIKDEVKNLLFLGTKPLGEVLFTDPNVERRDTEVSCLSPEHHLHQLASQLSDLPENLWGRRTLFTMHQQPLLVNEIFLPSLYK